MHTPYYELSKLCQCDNIRTNFNLDASSYFPMSHLYLVTWTLPGFFPLSEAFIKDDRREKHTNAIKIFSSVLQGPLE